jgi:hypothetical protein
VSKLESGKLEIAQKSLFGGGEEIIGAKPKKETAPAKPRAFPQLNWASALDKEKVQGDAVFWLRILQTQRSKNLSHSGVDKYVKTIASEIAIKQGKLPLALALKKGFMVV